MAPRRQREAAAPRQAANAGRRNLTGAAAARLGPRNQTAAAAPLAFRNQTAAATATGRPHARNRLSVGDIGNHGNAPVVDGEANRRCLTRNLAAQPNAAAADENNTIAPAETDTAETDTTVDHLLMKAVDVVEESARLQRVANQLKEEITGDLQRLAADFDRLESEKAEDQKVIEELEIEKVQKEAQVQKVMEELESEKAQRAAEVQKVMEENVRLRAMLDKKEAQLQAMSEQCKFMALNHHN